MDGFSGPYIAGGGGGKGAVAPPETFKVKFFIVQCVSHSTSQVMQLFNLQTTYNQVNTIRLLPLPGAIKIMFRKFCFVKYPFQQG